MTLLPPGASVFLKHMSSFLMFPKIHRNRVIFQIARIPGASFPKYWGNLWCIQFARLCIYIICHSAHSVCASLKVNCSWLSKLVAFLCRLRSIAAHRDHFVRRLSVCACVCLSGSHTFLIVTLVNTIETKPLHISLSNLQDMLTVMRGCPLLIL